MKKFTISAIMTMGVVALSSAAFAGTTSADFRGMVNNGSSLVSDTVVPTDTVVPEQKDTTPRRILSSAWPTPSFLPTPSLRTKRKRRLRRQKKLPERLVRAASPTP